MGFEASIARLNAACASHLSNADAQFQRGEPVRCLFNQTLDDEKGELRRAPRKWRLECPASDLVDAEPELNEIVVIDDVDYAISRIDRDRTSEDWVIIRVRPVR